MNEDEKDLSHKNDEQDGVEEEVLEESGRTEEAALEETSSGEPSSEETAGGETAAIEPVHTEEPVKVEKKLGKKQIIIAAAAAIVIAIVAIIVSVTASSPLALIGKGAVNSIEAFKENEMVSLVSAAAKGGSVELTCELESLVGYPLDGAVSVKLYTAADKAALVADVEVEGDSVFDASAFVDRENIAVGSDMLFGDEVYGISLKHLVENFNNSVFGLDGEFSLGIEISEDVGSVMEDSVEMMEDTRKVSQSTLKKLMKSVEDHAEIGKDSEVLDFNGTDVKVTAVEISANGEVLAAIVTDMLEYLRSDAELKEYLYRYADYLAVVMEETGLVYGGYEDMETVIDDFYEMLAEISDEDLEDMAEQLEEADIDLSMTFYITKSGKELVGVRFDGEADGESMKVSALAGPSWTDLEEISIRIDDGYSVGRISYVVDVNDKSEYSAELKIREDSESILTGEFTWDKEKGDFEAEVTDDWGDTYGIEGSIEVASRAATIDLDCVYGYFGEQDLGVSAVITTSDKMPAMPSYTEILKMDVEDVEDLVYDLWEILAELSYMFYY